MRGMFAGWLLLVSPIAMADEDPPPADDAPAEVTPKTTYELQIRSNGQYVLGGDAISRGELVALIQSDAGRAGSWRIDKAPMAASYALSSVTDLLTREGVTDVVLLHEQAAAAPEAPTDTATPGPSPAPTIMVAQPAAAAAVRPIADIRFGGAATGLGGSEALEYEFVINRVAAGAHAQLSEHVEAVVLLEGVERRGETSSGIVARVRDARVTFPLVPSGQLTAKVGVQIPIFGNQAWFNDDDSFYTVSRTFQSVTVLSGLHSVRALGASATATFQEDRGAFSVMMSNTGNYEVTEDNNGKDLSARLQYRVADPVTVILSGRTGARNTDDSGSLTAGDAAVRVDYGMLDAAVEGVIGSDNPGVEVGSTGEVLESTPAGTNVAAGVSIPLPAEMLSSVRINGRLAYFDPDLSADDADAWLITAGGVMLRWATLEGTKVLSGIGYDVRTPMDATLPVNHRAMLETHFEF